MAEPFHDASRLAAQVNELFLEQAANAAVHTVDLANRALRHRFLDDAAQAAVNDDCRPARLPYHEIAFDFAHSSSFRSLHAINNCSAGIGGQTNHR